MLLTDNLTMIGLSAIVLYVIIKILSFYGIGQDAYGYYITFYILMLVFILTLPDRPKMN